mgnify:CR=1 FL=1
MIRLQVKVANAAYKMGLAAAKAMIAMDKREGEIARAGLPVDLIRKMEREGKKSR